MSRLKTQHSSKPRPLQGLVGPNLGWKMNTKNFTRKSAFISVEISIKTNYESTAFVKWFEGKDHLVNKIEWHPEKWYIYCDPISGRDANSVIRRLCKMIQKLPPEVRKDWDRAKHREFYAGYHGGDEPRCLEEHISLSTLQAAVAVKAAIGFAIYPALPTDENGFTEDFYKNPGNESES